MRDYVSDLISKINSSVSGHNVDVGGGMTLKAFREKNIRDFVEPRSFTKHMGLVKDHYEGITRNILRKNLNKLKIIDVSDIDNMLIFTNNDQQIISLGSKSH